MALKVWLITFFLKEALKFVDLQSSAKSVSDLLNLYIKHLLVTEKERNFAVNLETVVRQAIRAFPYHQSVLFQTLVKSVANTQFVIFLYVGHYPMHCN